MLPAEQFANVEALQVAWSAHEQDMRAFLEELGETGITRVFGYKTLGGHPGTSTFWQMLQHVVNHASYHRGQVTTMLRQLGASPAKSMDMIAFYRERDAKS
jgi:uncharacterized damage-inducible protein DinB